LADLQAEGVEDLALQLRWRLAKRLAEVRQPGQDLCQLLGLGAPRDQRSIAVESA